MSGFGSSKALTISKFMTIDEFTKNFGNYGDWEIVQRQSTFLKLICQNKGNPRNCPEQIRRVRRLKKRGKILMRPFS